MSEPWCWLCEYPDKPCPHNCFEVADRLKDDDEPAQLGLELGEGTCRKAST